jgi:hypothetical protein
MTYYSVIINVLGTATADFPIIMHLLCGACCDALSTSDCRALRSELEVIANEEAIA